MPWLASPQSQTLLLIGHCTFPLDTALSGIAADEAAGTEYDMINQPPGSQKPSTWSASLSVDRNFILLHRPPLCLPRTPELQNAYPQFSCETIRGFSRKAAGCDSRIKIASDADCNKWILKS